MPTKLLSFTLAALMLSMALLCPKEAWASSRYCVGKTCGEQPWICCENAAASGKSCQVSQKPLLSSRRPNMRHSSRSGEKCDCAMVEKSATSRTMAFPSAGFVPEALFLSRAQTVLPTALMADAPFPAAEDRGPPGKLSACAYPSLRAPPAFNTHFPLS